MRPMIAALATISLGLLLIAIAAAKDDSVVTHPEPLDIPRFLRALKAVEGYKGKPGAAGEQGELQMTKAVFSVWGKNEVGYVYNLMGEARMIGRKPTPYLLALLHTAGYGAVLKDKVGAAKRDAAQRVENYYEAFP